MTLEEALRCVQDTSNNKRTVQYIPTGTAQWLLRQGYVEWATPGDAEKGFEPRRVTYWTWPGRLAITKKGVATLVQHELADDARGHLREEG